MSSIHYDPTRDALYHPEHRSTLLAQSQPADSTAMAVEAARLAYLRFEESTVQRDALDKALALADYGPATPLIDVPSDGAGFATRHSSGTALLAFRGTQADQLIDLLTDAKVAQQPWSLGPGHVHSGFADSALGLWPHVQQWLTDNKVTSATPLIICGHSLGAALATLLALPCKAQRLITIGSPRVGDAQFCDALANAHPLTITRIVDCCDAVTRVPPQGLGFRHVGTPTYIDHAGSVSANPPQSVIDHDRELARTMYLTRYALVPGNVAVRELADHAPINYARVFWP
ncbi:lipase family protein [Pseudomonas vancouverensis]|uniref:lipase family protein n=1 Tax=Pseudomonas vancouverensis TaxID=95300 RepID=UPI003D04B662